MPGPAHALGWWSSAGGCVTNKLFYGDNLEVLRDEIASEIIDQAALCSGERRKRGSSS